MWNVVTCSYCNLTTLPFWIIHFLLINFFVQGFRNLSTSKWLTVVALKLSRVCHCSVYWSDGFANGHPTKWRLPSKWAPPNLDIRWHSQPWGEVNSVKHETHIHQRMTSTCQSFISDFIHSTLLTYYIIESIYNKMSLPPCLPYFTHFYVHLSVSLT